jgi:hypothetical protein
MKIFLEDLWQDLREKRLWPVAVALAVALVAVPVLLKKPFQAPPPATPLAQSAADQSLQHQAKVVLANQESNGSRLNLFNPSDPFRAPASAHKKTDSSGVTSASGGGLSSTANQAASTGSGSTLNGGGGSLTPSSGGGGGGFSGGGTTGGGSIPKSKTKVTKFTFVIDVTYKHNGHTRKEKGMTALEMLPNSSSPLLVFLGVDSKATNAVFIVDSSLKPAPLSEGKCKPSTDNCNFLYLGAGNEEVFTTSDGQTYSLQIDGIRRVKVKSKSAKASSKKHKAGAKRSAASTSNDKLVSGQSSVQPRKPSHRFVPPVLLDLVTVSSDGARN